MTLPERNELKTGKRPVLQQIRSLKPGEILFEEGTQGREFFIMQEGRAGIYKDTPDGRIELAVVEQGGIIGEMSLLDNLPRSATVQALDPCKVLVVNQASFEKIMQDIPVWLQSIIKIVVSRLRDVNKRVDQSVLRDKERGLAHLLLLLLPAMKTRKDSSAAIEFNQLIFETFFICRLRKKEIKKTIDILVKRQLLTIISEKDGSQWVLVKEPEGLKLFDEYRLLKSQKQSFKEVSIPEEAVVTLKNIAYVAQKNGKESSDGTSIMKSVLVKDFSEKNAGQIDRCLLDLRRRSLINVVPSGSDMIITFRGEDLRRITKIKEWMPHFEREFS
ncbi:MAG: cyclic nucleotide-binding domain-containing protein [Chitinispirillaceae bacterium]|nr:cyclic nucleotide-binding domain-containing protein [Chitinispirillaceae bacterium]